MNKEFNVEGVCLPELHYMVNIEKRLEEIKILIDKGKYFVMNRARQYGKTTILTALRGYLQKDYLVVGLDFQKIGAAKFENENVFSLTFASYFLQVIQKNKYESNQMKEAINALNTVVLNKDSWFTLFELFLSLSSICAVSDQPIVMIIDEIDSATNNQVFMTLSI